MGLGSLGISELVVIFVIVLVFFGPRRFPEIARSMGSAMREFRRSLNQIQRELEEADPTRDLPGRDILKDIRAGKPGDWLDPTKSAGHETKRTSGDRSAPEPPGAHVTGEAAAQPPSPGRSDSAELGGEQLPMFGEGVSEAPEAIAPPPSGQAPTEGSRSD